MKLYVSGPITGTKDYLKKFKEAEEVLKGKGHSVINPAAVNSMMPVDTTYEEYMKMSMTMLEMCDGIVLLDGWQGSRGANREYGYALGRDMEVFPLDVSRASDDEKEPEGRKHKKESEESVKKKGKTSSQTKQKKAEIDKGKILALRKAGWTVKDIAEEMGCATGTISAYLWKMKKGEEEQKEKENAGKGDDKKA